MNRFSRLLAMFALILAIPVVPFVIWGNAFDTAANALELEAWSPGMTAITVFLLLSLDVFLPVPSSVVNTVAGAKLGLAAGSLVCFAGLSAGAALGFGLAKWAGPIWRRRWRSDDDVLALDSSVQQWGTAILIVTRGLPVLAEASILLLGLENFSWRRFWPPVLLSNAGIAAAYAAFGSLAAEHQWLVAAMAISAGLPLLATWVARRYLIREQNRPTISRDS